jgi:hypothetical protein
MQNAPPDSCRIVDSRHDSEANESEPDVAVCPRATEPLNFNNVESANPRGIC